MINNSTKRFSNKVLDYVKYRPDYPPQVIEFLKKQTGLSATYRVADIGSGTGIFTKHLLDLGCEVFAVEPNEPMRLAAEEMLKEYPNMVSVSAPADETTLPDHSVDLIVSAQAFHWFNTAETKKEFQRILKPDSFVALLWNKRIAEADAFSMAYDVLLQQKSTDYKEINHRKLDHTDFSSFFRDGNYTKVTFPNYQFFDESGLIGRASSSSYVPLPDTHEGKVFINELKTIFNQYQQNGEVKFQYSTEVYLGQI